jgi:hypothetical protein
MDVQRANRDAANAALKIAREELAQMKVGPCQGDHRLAGGDHLMVADMHAGGNPAEGRGENLFTSLDIRNTAYRPVVRINTLPGREFTAEYKVRGPAGY